MEDKMPWPLQPADLTDDKIPLPESLSTFMNVLVWKTCPMSNCKRNICKTFNYFLRLKCRKEHCFCIRYSYI